MAKNREEKSLLVSNSEGKAPTRSYQVLRPFLQACLLVGVILLTLRNIHIPSPWNTQTPSTSLSEPKCPQVEPLAPSRKSEELDAMEDFLTSETFRNKSIARLSGAVKVPTESFDDLGAVGKDPRWDVFYPFASYLRETFPLVHSTLQLEKINTHALLFTWAGTDPTLKPTLFMAHQDVVPVPESTVKQWTHPPFSGHYDGTFIWGRGASDCKNQLIAILEAVEALIEANFTPQRTLILSFGFDEEISGQDGANHLAPHILSNYGHDSIAVIVDEGAVNVESWGANFALPGVAEKGYVDVDVVVRMPGGHSSIPPKHNGIGVSSELITLIENNPYEPHLDESNPYLSLLHCGAEHAPEFPSELKHLLQKRTSSNCKKQNGKDHLALEAAKAGPGIKYLFTTSVAVDIIHGGVKNNALPERTQFTVNHRINVGSSSAAVLKHITALAAQVAEKYNLTLTPFNGTESPSSITLSHRDTLLEPAPVTPTQIDAKKDTPFSILSGTTRALYGKDLLVAPGIMTGNTDTRYYWGLSEHIFRYGPGWDKEQNGMGNIHTVDEKVGVTAHVDTVRWFWAFVRNMDEANL
ncbi:vacuolar carboxypeptidase-like protein Cps1 [Corynespora cassiicola Philippines]|uniref:Vacuolar carboxypeptidase-like protein Cps1 n=1 Tax=Corynespora cassiicola Philippines TaxID=1448308 RepID=A0A2T2P745_CORCC|nr:vacuolar carboxypeptidase-like protein Cps1 [Corynespora cassiicola Philippines]